MPQWDRMSQNVSNSRDKRTVSARNGPFQHADGSVVELADALDWPMTRVNSLGKLAHDDNGSVQTATSMITVKGNKTSCEKPRSLV